jgi:predicted lipoprotein with Yx(FWY)xxD motif
MAAAVVGLLGVSSVGAVGAVGAAAPTSATPGTAPIEISAGPSPWGRILIIGAGRFAGFTVYALSSDQPPDYGCTSKVVNLGGGHKIACTQEWPPVVTSGPPVAGPGVNASLLSSVYRSDLNASQVTYAGHPLYLFDNGPHQYSGANFDEPGIPPWHGVWYMVNPFDGSPAPINESVSTVTLIGGRTVLGGYKATLLGPEVFPLYVDSADTSRSLSCIGACAVEFPPLLTGGPVKVAPGSGLSPADLGTRTRPGGLKQVTYLGQPVYLYSQESIDLAGPPYFTGNGDGVAPSTGGTMSLVTP